MSYLHEEYHRINQLNQQDQRNSRSRLDIKSFINNHNREASRAASFSEENKQEFERFKLEYHEEIQKKKLEYQVKIQELENKKQKEEIKFNRLLNVIAMKLGFTDMETLIQEHDLMCCVCMELTICKTRCNHTVCEDCLRKIENNKCPICRQTLL